MLSLLQIPYSLATSMLFLFPISFPFCILQLALCRFCKNKYLRLAPAILGGILLLISFWIIALYSGYEALFGLLVMIPALMLLSGSGFGWLIWYLMRKYQR